MLVAGTGSYVEMEELEHRLQLSEASKETGKTSLHISKIYDSFTWN